MKKKAAIFFLTALLLALSGCTCRHEWAEATCEQPKTCRSCQETEGEPLGHSWTEADCENPKICIRCQSTEGEALGHSWTEADCEVPRTCTQCQQTQGDPLGHKPSHCVEQTDFIQCQTVRNCSCSRCGIDLETETIQLETLVKDNLFRFTPREFMERLVWLTETQGIAAEYTFSGEHGFLTAMLTIDHEGYIIQFFNSGAAALIPGEEDSAKIWCINLTRSGSSAQDIRSCFYMACDPLLDMDSASETDILLSTAYLNAASAGQPFGYWKQHHLLYELIWIQTEQMDLEENLTLINVYASDFR